MPEPLINLIKSNCSPYFPKIIRLIPIVIANIHGDTIAKANEQCEKINLLLETLNTGQDASALCPMAREATLAMLDTLSETPPFSYMDIPKHRERIERVFTAENALKYVEFATKAATNSLQFEEIQNYAEAITLQRYTHLFFPGERLAAELEQYALVFEFGHVLSLF